jgi:hypothetical protein
MHHSGALLIVLVACGAQKPTVAEKPGEATEEESRFLVSIDRTYDSEYEAELIRLAETENPPADEVVAAYNGELKIELDELKAEPSPWWCHTLRTSSQVMRLPYAITDDALAYYTTNIESFQDGDIQPLEGYRWGKVSLNYKASVTFEESFTLDGQTFSDVHVVRLTLTWYQCQEEAEKKSCSQGMGYFFEFAKERIVVFDPDGNAVLISGDGPAETEDNYMAHA